MSEIDKIKSAFKKFLDGQDSPRSWISTSLDDTQTVVQYNLSNRSFALFIQKDNNHTWAYVDNRNSADIVVEYGDIPGDMFLSYLT